MQFGKVQGIALMVLGIILIGIQATLAVPRTPAGASAEAAPKTAETKTSIVPGIVGAISLIGGIAVFATARRTNEPPPKDAVK
jgi:hypothetical protein